ncbi:MAG: SGNH/GDSL hydrolase family protein [Eubacteriales bacterium]|nr:SGNH/GDSL hydrolase family protein [Eubacteriales bacterium]
METIVCTGDSHTWGQGPAGVEAHFTDPPVTAGDLRPVPFGYPCYVNLLRDEINRHSGSYAFETEPKTEIECEYVTDKPADLARFYYRREGPNNITVESVFASDGVSETENAFYLFGDTITVKPKHRLYLYRCELYSGHYAVINAGVGSCTTSRYLKQFYKDYVRRHNPCLIIAQAHSINDWLNKIPLTDVNRNLRHILTGCPQARSVLLTVSPIGGETALPFNETDYEKYITESRLAAQNAGCAVADGYFAIGTDTLSDNWHVNDTGHRIYYETIISTLDSLFPQFQTQRPDY